VWFALHPVPRALRRSGASYATSRPRENG
jgi:hypothetical protein